MNFFEKIFGGKDGRTPKMMQASCTIQTTWFDERGYFFLQYTAGAQSFLIVLSNEELKQMIGARFVERGP